MNPDQYCQAVYLVEDGRLDAELSFAEFDARCVSGKPICGGGAAKTRRAVYVLVGPQLMIRGLVFFVLPVDERGCVRPEFNVPLDYLVRNAGPGPDLGAGPVVMACRGQCPIPWHANDLWDPAAVGETLYAALTARVAKNSLGFSPSAVHDAGAGDANSHHELTLDDDLAGATHANKTARGDGALIVDSVGPVRPPQRRGPTSAPSAPVSVAESLAIRHQIDDLLNQHATQLMELQQRHDQEMEDQAAEARLTLELYRKEIERLQEELREYQHAQARSEPHSVPHRNAS